MFEFLDKIIERVKYTMLNKSTIKNAIGAELAATDEMASAMGIWSDMYENDTGLHLPAAIASEIARMVTIELHSTISGSARADYLNKKYSELIENIRIPVEYGCAKGGLVFKPYVTKNGLAIDCVQADSFYPVAFDNSGRITGAVFAERITKGNTFYTRLEHHSLKDNRYTVTNKAYKSFSKGSLGYSVELTEVDVWSELTAEMTIDHVHKPLFGYFKPALANTIDPRCPLGVSVFANAVDLIEDANRQYSRLLWEFESGERALFANSMAFKLDKNGKLQLPDRRLYRTLDVEDVDFFKEWSPTLRDESLANGLDRIFRQIEFSCGLAYGTFSDVNSSEKTAEEIRVSKQRSFSTISDNQKSLKNALCDLVYAMDVWCTLYNLAPMGSYSISFDFDDSIAADRQTEFEEKRKLVDGGIMQPWEFRMWYFGEDEETAKAAVGTTLKNKE